MARYRSNPNTSERNLPGVDACLTTFSLVIIPQHLLGKKDATNP